MPQVIKKPDGRYEIVLNIESEFIKKYNLINNLSYLLPNTHPYNSNMPNLNEELVSVPYYFPPYEILNYTKEHLEYFLQEFKRILPKKCRDNKHIDHLLALSCSFPSDTVKRNMIDRSKILRKRARLVAKLFKIPLFEINKDNYEDFIDDDEELLAYIQLTYKPGDLKDHPDEPYSDELFQKDGLVDKLIITEYHWEKIFRCIEQKVNITIPINFKKRLTISKDIPFKISGIGLVSEFHESLQLDIVENLVATIIAEQREAKSSFYQLLCSDFDRNEIFRRNSLLNKLGDYQLSGYNQWVYNLAIVFKTYLNDERIAHNTSKQDLSKQQLEIIHPILLFLGLLLVGKKEPTAHINLNAFETTVNAHYRSVEANPLYGVDYLKGIFKNMI
jgi:hypothetical protein